MTNDTRYPYTYACDLMRGWAGYDKGGTILSRSDASMIRSELAKVLGMDDHELACKLADYYKANEDALTEQSVRNFRIAQSG